MPDREKVIKGLLCCAHTDGINCVYCPYDNTDEDCTALMSMDVLNLLKEQEAVKPKVTSSEQRCGNCNKVIEMDGWKSCPWCGKPIAWSEWWNENGGQAVK